MYGPESLDQEKGGWLRSNSKYEAVIVMAIIAEVSLE